MTQHIAVQCAFQAASLKSEDAQINTWHFGVESSPPASTTLDAINTAIFAYYTVIKAYFSTNHVTGTYIAKYYNYADPKPRIPIQTVSNTLTGLNTSGGTIPEVTVALSYQAVLVSGTNPASRKGRLYMPSMAANVFDSNGFVGAAAIAAMKTAAIALLGSSDTAPDWAWSVYSPTKNVLAPIVKGWVDNGADIQRRRGRAYSIRSLWP